MRERRRTSRRLALTAAVLVAIGTSLVHSDAASASSRDRSFAVIKFWPARNVVTLNIPPACPDRHPDCVWVLFVNEPETPAQTFVGSATGTSGVLTVAYPVDFCGVVQADAMVGPAPLKIEFGHRATVHSGSCSPDAAGSALPFTASSPTPTVADAIVKTEPAQLPFTGINLKPLTIVGMSLVLLGLNILTTVEQRRRGMRRARYTVRSNPAGVIASRVSRWFLGD